MSKKGVGTKTNSVDDVYYSKPFLGVLITAVMFAKYAGETEDKKLSKLLARASILHTALAVEALANNMIQFLRMEDKLAMTVERLTSIAKIQLFSLILMKVHLERGTRPIQVMEELISIRDNYVHPKITAVQDSVHCTG